MRTKCDGCAKDAKWLLTIMASELPVICWRCHDVIDQCKHLQIKLCCRKCDNATRWAINDWGDQMAQIYVRDVQCNQCGSANGITASFNRAAL